MAPCLGRLKCAGCSFAPVLVLHSIRSAPPSDTRFARTDTAATVCVDCEIGKYSSTSASSGCTICDAGKFSEELAVSACTDCPSGTYLPGGSDDAAAKHNSVEDCQPCLAGESSGPGSTDCVVCSPGRYGKTQHTALGVRYATCHDCPSGKYLDDIGVSTKHDNVDDCTDCDAGTYSAGGAAVCTNCDAGKYSGKESDPTGNKRGSLLRPA